MIIILCQKNDSILIMGVAFTNQYNSAFMDIQNIKGIVNLMGALGFSPSMDKKIVYHACFRQKDFSLKEKKAFGDDVMSYQIFFKENAANGKLVCTHYDAALRKNIKIQPVLLNGIDLHQMDERMNNINWEDISQFNGFTQFNLSDKETWKQQAIIEEIILDLEAIASTSEGELFANTLKYKYWADLPLENMIPSLYLLKSKLEFNQRFYIINDEGITANEAFRFLNNRWIQRQAQEKKKIDLPVEAEHQKSKQSANERKGKKRVTKTK